MNPDIEYIIRMRKDRKEMAIDHLKEFCINTDDFMFDPNLVDDDCMLNFVLEDEDSTKWFKELYKFSNVIHGRTIIGNIQLWIKYEEGFCDFIFWPLSSSLGRVCLNSSNLLNAFIEFVKRIGGLYLLMSEDNGKEVILYENEMYI